MGSKGFLGTAVFYGRTVGELAAVLREHAPGLRVMLDGSEGFVVRVVGPDLRLDKRQPVAKSLAAEQLNASNDG